MGCLSSRCPALTSRLAEPSHGLELRAASRSIPAGPRACEGKLPCVSGNGSLTRVLTGEARPHFRQPAGSAEDPAPRSPPPGMLREAASPGPTGRGGLPALCRTSSRPSTPWHRPPHRPGVLPGGQVCGTGQVCPHRTCGAAQVSGGTRGQVSWCSHRTCGAAQVSRAQRVDGRRPFQSVVAMPRIMVAEAAGSPFPCVRAG